MQKKKKAVPTLSLSNEEPFKSLAHCLNYNVCLCITLQNIFIYSEIEPFGALFLTFLHLPLLCFLYAKHTQGSVQITRVSSRLFHKLIVLPPIPSPQESQLCPSHMLLQLFPKYLLYYFIQRLIFSSALNLCK